MDPRDRLFGEIAVRLQLLTREQVQSCMERQSSGDAGRIGEIAVAQGFITNAEAELVGTHQARILARRRNSTSVSVAKETTLAPQRSSAVAEERVAPRARDPRSESATDMPVVSQPAQVRPAQEVTATDPGDRGARRANRWATAAPGEVQAQQAQPAPQAPRARQASAAATAPAATAEVDAFPMATGDERATVDLPSQAAAAVHTAPTPVPARVSIGYATVAEAAPAFATAGGDDADADARLAAEAMAAAASAAGLSAEQAQRVLQAAGGAMFAGDAAGAGPDTARPAPAPSAARAAAAPAQHEARARAHTPQAHPAGAAQAPPAQRHEPDPPRTPTAPPPRVGAQRPASNESGAQTYLGKALTMAMRQGASDLHAHSGAPIMLRIDGELRALGGGPIAPEAAERVIAEVMTDEQWALLRDRGEVDFAYAIDGVGRFRVNVYRQQRGLDAVFRLIPPIPPTLEQLGLPARLGTLCDFRTGMVLCTGPAGCGKSTTLAALLNLLVQTRPDHILTVEDPIEYVFPPGAALVNQRQVRDHTGSFARALRAALREDPDIIAITELRDRETVSLAISAAETGHLVLGTLHTENAGQTISRMINTFPADEREQIRAMLSESLRAVISQRLVPLAAGRGRVPALELLMVNTAVSNVIRDDKPHQLPSVMQTGKAAGMITLDDSLAGLLGSGTITKESARKFAVRKERFK